ncbi:MAG: ribonuclease HII [Lysobacterales bacterium]|nr:MAG: ribonuclease HII [Xanthomonadales bacterium]
MLDCELIAGVDEAGRGPLAGPVLAAAVVLDPRVPLEGLRDSNLLTAAARERLASLIRERAYAWSLGRAEVDDIDRINILQATLLAMARAVAGLPKCPHRVLVDGLHCPRLPCRAEAVVGGDRRIASISAASILAKVSRDAEMVELDCRYPEYGFGRHKGYPTREHREALRQHGPCPFHRRSFAPVRAAFSAHSLILGGNSKL